MKGFENSDDFLFIFAFFIQFPSKFTHLLSLQEYGVFSSVVYQ
jgi:hypothetical protein